MVRRTDEFMYNIYMCICAIAKVFKAKVAMSFRNKHKLVIFFFWQRIKLHSTIFYVFYTYILCAAFLPFALLHTVNIILVPEHEINGSHPCIGLRLLLTYTINTTHAKYNEKYHQFLLQKSFDSLCSDITLTTVQSIIIHSEPKCLVQ